MSKANFIMPEFYEDFEMNKFFIKLMRDYPEMLNQDTTIYTFYGNFPRCIWNGGRNNVGNIQQPLKSEIKDVFAFYNEELHLPLQLTFTNSLIDNEKYCFDTYANIIAECGHNGKNQILVTSKILEDYLRKNYPNYKYCRSIISTIEGEPYINDKKYFLRVLSPNWGNDAKKLLAIPKEERQEVEVLCNEGCLYNCPYRKEHFYNMNLGNLTCDFTGDKACCASHYEYIQDERLFHHYVNQQPQYISNELIHKIYLPLGFKYFKLSGRGETEERCWNWIKYIFKPQFAEDIFYNILKIKFDVES